MAQPITNPKNNQQPDNRQQQTTPALGDQQIDRGHANPLGAASNYVVGVLHSTLEDVRKGRKTFADFYTEVKDLVETPEVATAVTNLVNEGSMEAKKLALLELMLLKNALHYHNTKIPVAEAVPEGQQDPLPTKLTEHIASLANDLGEIPFLTYDLVVRANKDKVTRTFTGFEHEISFYQDHERIEKLLDEPAKNLIEEMGKIPPDADLNRIDFAALTQKVKDLQGNLQSSLEILLKVTKLDIEEFNLFREYFYSPDKERYPGPSGYFSGNLTALMNACLGRDLGRADSIIRRQYLYPLGDLRKIVTACDLAKRGLDLNSLSQLPGCPQEFKAEVFKLNSQFHRWFGAHRAGVKRTIPAVYKNNLAATGENLAKELLDETVNRFKQACDNLTPPAEQNDSKAREAEGEGNNLDANTPSKPGSEEQGDGQGQAQL